MNYLLIKYANTFGLIDVPNERSMHKELIPRGAGIAFVLAVYFTLLFFNFEYLKTYYYIYLAIGAIFTAGIWDDLKGVSPKTKFIFIFFASLPLYFNDIAIFSLGTYFGYEALLPHWLVFPVTLLAIAGFTNALNLMDGLDGLATLVSIVILTTFLAIGLQHKDELLISLSSLFITTLLAFLIFNWNPAKIFMGDSGSLTLGIVISILSIQALHYNTPASILLIIAMPLLDTFIVMTRRIQRHLSPFKADRNHMHHFAFNVKGDVRFTVIMLTLTQVLFSIIGYQVSKEDNLLSLVLFAILFYIFLNLFDQRLRRRKKEDKK
jgi:UDP-GlcNAc:undecaprenyl-phosphate GlcNAc-1-phosphate transferase